MNRVVAAASIAACVSLFSVAGRAFATRPLWGDTHLHTSPIWYGPR